MIVLDTNVISEAMKLHANTVAGRRSD